MLMYVIKPQRHIRLMTERLSEMRNFFGGRNTGLVQCMYVIPVVHIHHYFVSVEQYCLKNIYV